jgi:hypothetical protein
MHWFSCQILNRQFILEKSYHLNRVQARNIDLLDADIKQTALSSRCFSLQNLWSATWQPQPKLKEKLCFFFFGGGGSIFLSHV